MSSRTIASDVVEKVCDRCQWSTTGDWQGVTRCFGQIRTTIAFGAVFEIYEDVCAVCAQRALGEFSEVPAAEQLRDDILTLVERPRLECAPRD